MVTSARTERQADAELSAGPAAFEPPDQPRQRFIQPVHQHIPQRQPQPSSRAREPDFGSFVGRGAVAQPCCDSQTLVGHQWRGRPPCIGGGDLLEPVQSGALFLGRRHARMVLRTETFITGREPLVVKLFAAFGTVLAIAASGCTIADPGPRPGSGGDAATTEDGSTTPDATTPDATSTPDATTPDATSTPDATTPDASSTPDATTPDATSTPDATTPDASSTPDATTPDASSTPDATTPDASGTPDVDAAASDVSADTADTASAD